MIEIKALDVFVNTVTDHWDLYSTIEARFNKIFAPERRSEMLRRLNDLRLASSVWDDAIHNHVATERVALFNQVDELSKLAVRFWYNDRMIFAYDPEEAAYYKKTLHDLEMILYRHAKVYRKETRPVSLSLLTPGTVIQYFVNHVTSRESGPQTVTIKSLSRLSGDTCIITTEETSVWPGGSGYSIFEFPTSKNFQFNSSHVTRVLKHVPGPLKITQEAEKSGEVLHRDMGVSQVGKSRNTYVSAGGGYLARAEIERLGVLTDSSQCLDTDLLWKIAVYKSPGVRISPVSSNRMFRVLTRKKKWKRWVRQNMNRFLLSRKLQKERERDYQRHMDESFFSDTESY